MRQRRAVAMTALVALFLAEGQRAFFASLFPLAYDALFPAFRPLGLLLALAPLLALFAPLLPLARWTDRAGAIALSALAVALFRIPMTYPALGTRLAAGALVLAGGAMFLTWAVGFLDRRALAGGVVLGLVVDQLLRLAGSSYDLSLQPWWLPVQAVVSLGAVAAVLLWHRGPAPDREEGLERRAGGLRLRGAMALGALLFLDLHIVGLPPVIANWTGAPYPLAAGLVVGAGALAVVAALVVRRPTRGRGTTLVLVAGATAAILFGFWGGGRAAAVAMALAHLATLLLITRALDPASGRRSGAMVTAGFWVLALTTLLYALTSFPAHAVPALDGATPWLVLGIGVLLAGAFILLPRPAELGPLPGLAAAIAALAVVATGSVVLLRSPPGLGAGQEGQSLRVATWNVHYGYDASWRFDPGAQAEVLAALDADVIALQEVPAGAPIAYGIDLAHWLGRRLGMRHHFAPTGALVGEAFLTARPSEVETVPLPRVDGEAAQLLRLRTRLADEAPVLHALHLSVRPDAGERQLEAALQTVEPGPAVILGDLNAAPGSRLIQRLARAGFDDVFGDRDRAPATFPAARPARRIDWIRVRGLEATGAVVPATEASDHRPVAATLHRPSERVGSSPNP